MTPSINYSKMKSDALWAAAAMVLSFLVAVVTWRLWRANLHIPIFSVHGDVAYELVMVKTIMQHGWYETNSNLAAPIGQVNYDFPAFVGELGKVLMVKALGVVFSNPAVVMNAMILGGFPLIALTAFLALRGLGFSKGVTLVCAVLFATSPIHFVLGPVQVLLGLYIGIPLSGYLILAVLGEKPLFAKRERSGGRWSSWLSPRSAITIGMALLIGCLGLDYAEFTCLLLGICALLVFMIKRRVTVLVTAILVIVIIAIPVLGSAVPDLAYRAAHGTNTAVAHRLPLESLVFGLPPIQLIMPQQEDRIGPLAELTARVDGDLDKGYPGLPIDIGSQVSLGLLSAIGLIWILWIVVSGAMTGRQFKNPLANQVGTAALITILLAMTSGGSVLFAYLVTAQLRVWARIAILIGFFAVIGLALLLERARGALGTRTRGRWWISAVLLLALVGGVFEGTTNRFIPNYEQFSAAWSEDTRFVAQVQHSLPRNAMVLELPYIAFPEARLPTGLTSYEPMVPYLHSTALRWSAGAMEGRPTDWLASASTRPTNQLIADAVAVGFGGVYVLRSGYADQGAAVVDSIQALIGAPPLNEADGDAAFFDLTPYAARLRRKVGAARLAAVGAATIYPPTLSYGSGFYEAEPTPAAPRWARRIDTLAVDNPAKTTQVVRYSTVLITGSSVRSPVNIMWPDGTSTRVLVSNRGYTVKRSLVLRPGENTIRFTTDAPRVKSAPGDLRELYLGFTKTTLTSAGETILSAD